MDDATTALARRWRAARGFGWIEGMLTTRYGRVRAQLSIGIRAADVRRRLVVDDPDAELYSDFDGHPDAIPVPAAAIPDLDDPLTRMAALLMARATWDQPMLCVKPYGDGWAVTRPPAPGAPGLEGMLAKILGQGPTEIEALIHALEAAPETKV